MCVQTSIEIVFIKVKNQDTEIKLTIPNGVATMDIRGVFLELLLSFCNGLGTIYIASFSRKDH